MRSIPIALLLTLVLTSTAVAEETSSALRLELPSFELDAGLRAAPRLVTGPVRDATALRDVGLVLFVAGAATMTTAVIGYFAFGRQLGEWGHDIGAYLYPLRFSLPMLAVGGALSISGGVFWSRGSDQLRALRDPMVASLTLQLSGTFGAPPPRGVR